MHDDTSISFLEEPIVETKTNQPTGTLNSLLADDDIISPVSDNAKQARIALQNEYQTQKNSFSKSKSVVNATNLFVSNHLRLPRRG